MLKKLLIFIFLQAHVVCIVYSVDDFNSVAKVSILQCI